MVAVRASATQDRITMMRAYYRWARHGGCMAVCLETFRARQGWSHEQLCSWLDIDTAGLVHLGLCGLPAASEPRRARDIQVLASALHLNYSRLRAVVTGSTVDNT